MTLPPTRRTKTNQQFQAKTLRNGACRRSWVLAHNACKCLGKRQKRDHKNDNSRKKVAQYIKLIDFYLQC